MLGARTAGIGLPGMQSGYQWFSLQDMSPDVRRNGTRAAAPVLDAYIEKMQLTPEQIRRRANVSKALAKHAAELSEDEIALREEMIRNYGIDPLSSSEFTYKNDNEPDATPSSPGEENLFA